MRILIIGGGQDGVILSYLISKNFEKYFNKSQILILDYENISRKPNDFLQKVFSFLNVDVEFVPEVMNKNIKHKKDIRKDIQIANKDIIKVREFYSNF